MLQTDLIAPVPELLRRHARERGAKFAYRDAHSQVTYAELLDHTGRIAGHLADNGVESGDTVAIMLPNSVQWVEACFGITRGGAIGVPISYDSSEPEIAYRLGDAICKAVFTTAERADLFVKLQRDAPNLKTLIVADRGLSSAKALRYRDLIGKAASSAPRDPPLMHEHILYTSGTTGRAKGVKLTVHGMLWVAAACWGPITGLGERDTVLSPLPLFHSYALNLSVLSILATGASEYIMERFSTGEAVRLLKTGEFTYFPGVPTMFHYLLQATKDEKDLKIPGLRLCASAGAIMPATLNRVQRAAARWLRNHRNFDHGDDELAVRRACSRLLRAAAAGPRRAYRRARERHGLQAGPGRGVDRARAKRDAWLSQQA